VVSASRLHCLHLTGFRIDWGLLFILTPFISVVDRLSDSTAKHVKGQPIARLNTVIKKSTCGEGQGVLIGYFVCRLKIREICF